MALGEEQDRAGLRAMGTPATPLAAFGMGALLLAMEGDRLSTLRITDVPDRLSFEPLLALLVIMCIIVWQRKKLDAPRHQTPLSLVAAALFSLSLFSLFGQGAWVPFVIPYYAFQLLNELCQALLLFFWIRMLLPYGARAVATVFGCSTVILGLLSCLTVLLKTEAALSVVATLPVISAICLCYLREYMKSHDAPPQQEPQLSLTHEHNSNRLKWAVFVMAMMLPVFCYAFAFGNIHFRWVQIQDGAVLSMLVQLGAASGTILAGLLMLALAYFFWNRDNVELFRILLLPILIFSLWLSSSTSEGWIFLYLALLNIAQKLVFLFIMLAPFMLKLNASKLIPWWLVYMAFLAGKMLSSLMLMNMDDSQSMTSSILSIAVLLVCCILPALLVNAHSATRAAKAGAEHSPDPPGETGQKGTMKLHKAAHALAERHMLTKREEEILVLLARGRTAKYVSETLFISQMTAKTHQKSIYAKMQVHSQQELIGLVEEAIDAQRSDPG